jgi:Tol biopolymer transport system component
MGGWTWDNWDVYVSNKDGNELRRITSHNYRRASHPRFADDAKRLVYSADGDYPDSRTYLFTVLADGSRSPDRLTLPPNFVARTPRNANDFRAWGADPAVSADGKLLTFISDRAAGFQYDVFVLNSDGTDPRPLGVTKISRYNAGPVFLPDGKRILFLAGTGSNLNSRPLFSLWEVDIVSTKSRRIFDSGLFTNSIRWRPKH